MLPPVVCCACEFPGTARSMNQIHFGLQAVFQPFSLGDTCSAYSFCALGEFIEMVR